MKTVPAGFWWRSLAHLVDSILLNVLALGFDWVYSAATGSKDSSLTVQIVSAGFYVITAGIYFTVGHSRYGTTLGKRLCRIEVLDSKTGKFPSLERSLARYCAYLVSYLPFGAGFVMAGLQPDKRALHELITGTYSVRRVRSS
jgi:uncharacterized RDD family membrane protein YckC